MSRGTQKTDVSPVNEECSLMVCTLHLRHIFGDDVRNHMGTPRRRKRTRKSLFAYNIVRIHSLMIWNKIFDCLIFGDRETPFLPCFPSISKLKPAILLLPDNTEIIRHSVTCSFIGCWEIFSQRKNSFEGYIRRRNFPRSRGDYSTRFQV